VAEAPPHGRQLLQPGPSGSIVRPPAAVTDRSPVGPDHSTPPPLAPITTLAQGSHGPSSCDGRHHFFAAMSFSMALSSIASASSFFSRRFSSSSAFRGRASDTSSPPYFAFHL